MARERISYSPSDVIDVVKEEVVGTGCEQDVNKALDRVKELILKYVKN